jgi:hypothetical protein
MMHIAVHLKTGIQKSDFKKTYHASEWLSSIKGDGMVTIRINKDSVHHFKNIKNSMSWVNLQKND